MKKTQIILLLALFTTIGNSVQAVIKKLTDETIDGVRVISFTNDKNIPKEEYNKKRHIQRLSFWQKQILLILVICMK
ncbi:MULTISPECIES: hypothetical protein [Pasteurellaceae]|uniref:Uncharacterized protein n=1 Tax=Pasteurella atlantica TaxID=2827233 RepID=A0AAW8CRS9_9PAST|nr:hypothetical protein [Pasteurella atlantica]MBR0573670.1 hypothetical protein [Pasteurella atlantica]MDP8039425.1 hypothetical protein [Pasteurella atlantica]MDP8041517.1 hypothetical protein [Pasteurella atlantica]MDP8043558.1 hypothetical protein [Pasteurella atlantica]MDP8045738.1 hypothetical protein [Pasteurella atlantica]